MGFRNVVCWNPTLVPRVMDIEALQADADSFLATHSPMRMRRLERIGGRAFEGWISEEGFLEEFLRPPNHSHAAIMGSTGSGKSHLVRWLSMRIPETEKRRVVLIRRSGTNLKDVIERILEGMEGPQFDTYRRRLETATANLTAAQAREQFLHRLAEAVGPNGPLMVEHLPDRQAQEEREYLSESLSALFRSDPLRDVWLSAGSVIDELAQHALGDRGRGAPQEFRVEDIPRNLEWQKLNPSARDFYSDFLINPDTQVEAIQWINRNRHTALQNLLTLSGDDLYRLLIAVREELGKQGRELVLLIEDFAKTEGIDLQLLEAMLVRPDQGEEKLCILRAAMAVTTGYNEAVMRETIRDRVNLVVDLDLEQPGAERVITRDEIARFAGRYLNAVRLGDEALRRWAQEVRATGDVAASPPNACARCEHRVGCHRAFGSVPAPDGSDIGIGLYPFTAAALERLSALAAQDRQVSFVPRYLIDRVLQDILTKNTEEIRAGRFPQPGLLIPFGGERMPPVKKAELRSRAPRDPDRYRVLFELWGDPDRLEGLNDEMFEAFGLEPIGLPVQPTEATGDFENGTEQAKQTEGTGDDSAGTGPTEKSPGQRGGTPEVISGLQDISDWSNGRALLPQDLVRELRELLFRAVCAYIDWDAEMLARDYYTTPTRFTHNSISFDRQQVAAPQTTIQIRLPLDGNGERLALALQGLLLYKRHRHWNFSDGGLHLRAYAECLESCSQEILRQLRQLRTEPEEWDPIPATVELLAIGARLHGYPAPGDHSLEGRVRALFHNWSSVTPTEGTMGQRAKGWQQLASVYSMSLQNVALGNALTEILKSRTVCTKGGELDDAQILDAAAIVPVLRARDGAFLPIHALPERMRSDYEPIQRVQKRVSELLAEATRAEARRWMDWLDGIREHVPEGTRSEELREALVRAAAIAVEAGVWKGRHSAQELENLARAFQQVPLATFLQATESLAEETELSRMLTQLGRADLLEPMAVAEEFVEAFDSFLTGTSSEIKRQIQLLRGGQVDVEEKRRAIGMALETLVAWTGELKGTAHDTDRTD